MPKPTCEKCGKPHPKCNGHNQAGNPCGRPVKASGVCRYHGGAAPQVMDAQARRDAEATAIALMESTLGHHRVLEHDDPLTGLLDEIARSEAACAFYAGQVRQLRLLPESREQEAARHAEAIANDTEPGDPHATILVGTMFGPVPSVWVKLWTDERMRHAKLCKAGIDAGLAERMVKVNEDVASKLLSAVLAAIGNPEVAMPPAMQSKLRLVIGQEIRQAQALPAAS